MRTETPRAHKYVFRIDTELTEKDAPKWLIMGEFAQSVDYRSFVFRTRGTARKLFGRELTIQMIRTDPPESLYVASLAAREREAKARVYALLYLLQRKLVRLKPLYSDPKLKLVTAIYVNERDLSEILRSVGLAG